MKKYFSQSLRSASSIWIMLISVILGASVLYATLSIFELPENIIVLITFIALIGLILLGLQLVPESLLTFGKTNRPSKLKIFMQKYTTQIRAEQKQAEQVEELRRIIDKVIRSQEQQQVDIDKVIRSQEQQQVDADKFSSNLVKQKQSINQFIEGQAQQQEERLEQLMQLTKGLVGREQSIDQLIENQAHQQAQIDQLASGLTEQRQSINQFIESQAQQEERLEQLTQTTNDLVEVTKDMVGVGEQVNQLIENHLKQSIFNQISNERAEQFVQNLLRSTHQTQAERLQFFQTLVVAAVLKGLYDLDFDDIDLKADLESIMRFMNRRLEGLAHEDDRPKADQIHAVRPETDQLATVGPETDSVPAVSPATGQVRSVREMLKKLLSPETEQK